MNYNVSEFVLRLIALLTSCEAIRTICTRDMRSSLLTSSSASCWLAWLVYGWGRLCHVQKGLAQQTNRRVPIRAILLCRRRRHGGHRMRRQTVARTPPPVLLGEYSFVVRPRHLQQPGSEPSFLVVVVAARFFIAVVTTPLLLLLLLYLDPRIMVLSEPSASLAIDQALR